jgi:hypothetical protein
MSHQFSKTYTEQDRPVHKIVRALQNKGYTEITVTWTHAMSFTRGWRMKSKQLDYKHLGYSVEGCLKTIIKLPEVVKVEQC